MTDNLDDLIKKAEALPQTDARDAALHQARAWLNGTWIAQSCGKNWPNPFDALRGIIDSSDEAVAAQKAAEHRRANLDKLRDWLRAGIEVETETLVGKLALIDFDIRTVTPWLKTLTEMRAQLVTVEMLIDWEIADGHQR